MSSPSEPTVYIDFLCPWAYRGAMWLADVVKAGRIRPEFRFFSLSQNHDAREGAGSPPIWERNPKAKGLPAFLAATAARAQGAEAGNRFRMALQRARHEDHLGVDEPATHHLVAERAGIDVARWEADLRATDFSLLAREHAAAVRRGVFGVPTLVWPEGRSYYLKINELIPAVRAVALYDAIETVHRFGEVIEIKTPESEGTLAA
ncbi:MAG TPA: DsbA family protein [Candidatus Dormibacteraeota bacterium]|nr:DsbA family protein [Candidatus Dormibacteraeota bacterium]